MRVTFLLSVLTAAAFTTSCGFSPQPTSGTVACAPSGARCCPEGYVCVGRGALTTEGLPSGAGTCWMRRDLPSETRNLVHDHTPSVSDDPACLVTNWLPPGLGWPDAAVSGHDGQVVDGGEDGSVDPSVTPTAGVFGDFPEGSASIANNWAINALHDNAQANDIVASPLTKKWVVHFEGEVSYPIVASGRVFVAANEAQPNIRALDVETGALLWGPVALRGMSNLACDAVNVYVMDKTNRPEERAGTLLALDAASGSTAWTTSFTPQYGFPYAPMVAGGMVYVGGGGPNAIYAVDAATGQIRWKAGIETTNGTVAVLDGVLYAAAGCKRLRTYDAGTGKVILGGERLAYCSDRSGATPAIHQGQLWMREFEGDFIVDLNGNWYGTFAADLPPSFLGDNAYLVNNGGLTAISVTNQFVKWSFSTSSAASPIDKSKLYTSAVIAGRGGQVFVGTGDGWIHELREGDGTLVSSDKAGDTALWQSEGIGMAIAHNHLFVPAGKDLVVY